MLLPSGNFAALGQPMDISPSTSPATRRLLNDGSAHIEEAEQDIKRRPMSAAACTSVLHDCYYPETSIPIKGWLQPCR